MEVGGSWSELGGGWNKLGEDGWSWVEVGAQFNNTHSHGMSSRIFLKKKIEMPRIKRFLIYKLSTSNPFYVTAKVVIEEN